MPVAVHVPGGARRVARDVVGVDAREHEAGATVAAACRQQAREREHRRKVPRLRRIAPEHDVALAGVDPSAGIGERGADERDR